MPANNKQKLGELFRNRRERGLPGLPVVSVTLNDGLVGRDTLDRKTDTNLAPEEHLLIKAGDIAYNMMRMWQGASGLAQHDGIVSPAYVVLAPKNGIDSLFASYWFKSPRLVYLFWAYSYGLTNDRLRLYFKDFARIPVSVPTHDEQVRIGKILSLWDTAIVQTEKLIEAKRKLKTGLMQQLLTGQRRFPGVEGEWKDTPLGQMGRCLSGGTPDTNNSSYWNGGIQWCTPSEITSLNSKYISSTERTLSNDGLNNSSANLLPPNTLIVCTRATVGDCAINTSPMATNQGFKSLILKQEYSPEFVYYLICHNKHQLVRYASGSTFLEISMRDFCNLIII
jgi:type I restriction enzyme, S subunit